MSFSIGELKADDTKNLPIDRGISSPLNASSVFKDHLFLTNDVVQIVRILF
jgi:hypothetical protein